MGNTVETSYMKYDVATSATKIFLFPILNSSFEDPARNFAYALVFKGVVEFVVVPVKNLDAKTLSKCAAKALLDGEFSIRIHLLERTFRRLSINSLFTISHVESSLASLIAF